MHLTTWKLIYQTSKLKPPPRPTETPISDHILGKLPRRQAWVSSSPYKIGGRLIIDGLWIISCISSIILTIYMFIFLTKEFLILKSNEVSIITIYFFGMQLVLGTAAVVALIFGTEGGDLQLNITSYRWLHHQWRG